MPIPTTAGQAVTAWAIAFVVEANTEVVVVAAWVSKWAASQLARCKVMGCMTGAAASGRSSFVTEANKLAEDLASM